MLWIEKLVIEERKWRVLFEDKSDQGIKQDCHKCVWPPTYPLTRRMVEVVIRSMKRDSRHATTTLLDWTQWPRGMQNVRWGKIEVSSFCVLFAFICRIDRSVFKNRFQLTFSLENILVTFFKSLLFDHFKYKTQKIEDSHYRFFLGIWNVYIFPFLFESKASLSRVMKSLELRKKELSPSLETAHTILLFSLFLIWNYYRYIFSSNV